MTLSQDNIKRVQHGKTPIIDDEWVSLFPSDMEFLGQDIPCRDIDLTLPVGFEW